MSDILVTAKVNPDLDGTACTLAYSDLLTRTGIPADGLVFGTPQSEVRYFIDRHHIRIPITGSGFDGGWTKFILVDMSAMIGSPGVVSREKVIEIIDHREGIEDFPHAKIQNDLIGAAATIIVERFRAGKLTPQPDHAQLLYGAIFHNTLNFNSPNTADRDREAFLWLEQFPGCNPGLTGDMFAYATGLILTDIKTALAQDAKVFSVQDIKVGAYQLVVTGFDYKKYQQAISEGVEVLDRKNNCTVSYVSISDIIARTTYFYVSDAKSRHLLSSAFGLEFDSSGWARQALILRKQIVPRLLSRITEDKGPISVPK